MLLLSNTPYTIKIIGHSAKKIHGSITNALKILLPSNINHQRTMSSVLLNSRPTGCLPVISSRKTNDAHSCQPRGNRSVKNNLLAGYTAGVFGVLVGQPMDCLKVWAQTQPLQKQQQIMMSAPATQLSPSNSLKPSCTPAAPNTTKQSVKNISTMALSSGATHASPATTVSKVRALYAGIQGPLLLVGMVQSVNFAAYDSIRRSLYNYQHQDSSSVSSTYEYLHNDSLSNIIAAASFTGAGLSFLTSPFIVIKTRQQLLSASTLGAPPGFRDTVQTLLEQHQGSVRRAFYVGFAPHFVTETLGRAVYFGTYESLKRSLVVAKQHDNDASSQSLLSLGERMACAGSAGVACWSIIFPLDALKSRRYAATLHNSSSSSLLSMVPQQSSSSVFTNVRSLYRGFGVTILRAGPVAAAVLPIYDAVLERLSSSEW